MEEWSTFRLTGAALKAFGGAGTVSGADALSGSREAANRG
jgi:hypothetical protein